MTLSAPEAHERLMRSAGELAALSTPALVQWQRQQGRHHLPWQATRDPYRVWLSEIMLQQTQVATVLGYYGRFLARYPTVRELACAPLDDVLALWAGLGYYSRARNLHRCAQAVVSVHGGCFPATAALLQTLPGIGPSTAAAMASFCFGERVAILDGNVKRVLTRLLAWGEDLSIAKHEQQLWQAATALLPADALDMPAYTQGLMDLGATVCSQRKPNCLLCPWAAWCQARLGGQPEAFPVKTRKLKRSRRESWCLWLERVIEDEPAVWLVQRPLEGIWAGLWTLPMFDTEAQLLAAHPGPLDVQPSLKHALTHLDWHLHLRRAERVAVSALPFTAGEPDPAQGRWVLLREIDKLGLPAPFKRWLTGA